MLNSKGYKKYFICVNEQCLRPIVFHEVAKATDLYIVTRILPPEPESKPNTIDFLSEQQRTENNGACVCDGNCAQGGG